MEKNLRIYLFAVQIEVLLLDFRDSFNGNLILYKLN